MKPTSMMTKQHPLCNYRFMNNQEIKTLGETKETPIANIKPAHNNPRSITPRAVEITAASIKRFGWQQPIVVDATGTILAGHTRLEAAKKLKLKTVPVVVADHLTKDEADAYRIADNRTGDYSTWDYPELVKQLESLEQDFADELGIDDWQGIIDEFIGADEEEEDDEDITSIDLGEDEENEEDYQTMREDHRITVVCASKEAMNALELELIKRPEVLNVTYPRQ